MWVRTIRKFVELPRKVAEVERNVYFSAQSQISRPLSLQPSGTFYRSVTVQKTKSLTVPTDVE